MKKILLTALSIIFLLGVMNAQGMGNKSRGNGRGQIKSQLDETQHQAIRDMVRQMRDNNASREEITAAMRNKFNGWGIEFPNNLNGSKSRRNGGPRFIDNDGDGLNDFQMSGLRGRDGHLSQDGGFRNHMGQNRGGPGGKDHRQNNGRGMGRPRGDRGGRPPHGGHGGGHSNN
ncbi:MAG: hypothetical protein ISR82_03990 [Candidatus Marinimicrobia bacterium]|nr:hypothetical protein [Candidatus Neomarinimicrobiota bacterium]MBL7010362.1 hypothetical protein [Candidatus Neomarinimicrobiota bacterium]MBL7030753.1 hypothetical protein [Candidatus Neomarinimicrobiota bacterium]